MVTAITGVPPPTKPYLHAFTYGSQLNGTLRHAPTQCVKIQTRLKYVSVFFHVYCLPPPTLQTTNDT